MRAVEDVPAPASSPAEILARRLADAPTDADRDALIAAANPPADPTQLLRAMVTVGYNLGLQGELTRAEAYARFEEKYAASVHEQRYVLAARAARAGIHRQLGELAEALAIFSVVIAEVDEEKYPVLAVSAWTGRGIVYAHLADYTHALADYNHALALAEAHSYRDGAIPTLNSIGEVFRAEGQPRRALEYYQRARDWLGDDNAWNNTFIFNNIAQCYVTLGDLPKAADFLQRAEAIATKTGQKPRAATASAVLADIYRQQGRLDDAKTSLERSLALAREIRDPSGEGRAQLGLAEWARATGDHAAALTHAQAAVAGYRRANAPAELAAALTAAGREQRASGDVGKARAAFEEAIAVTEAVRGQLTGGDLDAQAYFASRVKPYQELVALLAENPASAAEALQFSERAKARTLLDIVRRNESDRTLALTDPERARETELNRRLIALNRRVTAERAAASSDGHAGQAQAEFEAACREWDHFLSDVAQAHPEVARLRPPVTPVSATEIARLTDAGKTALLEFVVAEDRTYLITTTNPDAGNASSETSSNSHAGTDPGAPQTRIFALDLGREALARRAEAFRAKLADRSLGWQADARALYDDLLADAAPVWASAARLVIVPDGPLWGLPFQALESAPNHCLWQDHALSLAPSLTFLQQSQRSPPESAPAAAHSPKLLALGNPALGESASRVNAVTPALMGDDFVPLPEAEKQLAAIRALYPADACRVYLGADAHEDTFKAEAGRYDILHLATHGILNDRNPLFSYLLMAQTNLAPDEDGLLEAREIMTLRLRARLAVLSACETGRGQVTSGEGVIGLGWALFVAGCPASILSQWKVDSAATTLLMVELHRQLRAGLAPDEALRRASLALAAGDAKYHHPYYWAPFVLVGAGE